MSASNFNLRNISPEIMTRLKKEASKQNQSVNSYILKLIEKGLGISYQTKKPVFHDLDILAGTWSQEEKKAFDKKIKSFEQIDEELWS